MAKKGIITTAQVTISDAAASGYESARALAESAAGMAAKAATGAVLSAVRGARRLVAVEKPRRRRSKVARKAAARKAVATRKRRKLARKAASRKAVVTRKAKAVRKQ